jgi:hypothetical protein
MFIIYAIRFDVRATVFAGRDSEWELSKQKNIAQHTKRPDIACGCVLRWPRINILRRSVQWLPNAAKHLLPQIRQHSPPQVNELETSLTAHNNIPGGHVPASVCPVAPGPCETS